MATELTIAATVPATTAEGPHTRFAVWVQGCTLRCPGCCNPSMFSADGGQSVEIKELVAAVEEAARTHGVEGITVLGGEPLQQLPALTALCSAVRARGLGTIVFSGFTLAEAQRLPGFDALWAQLDTLVDGRFDARKPEPSPERGGRRFIGSANQGLRHRTDRYRAAEHWRGPPRIEVQLDGHGDIDVHGEPGVLRDLLRALATQ